MHWSIALILLAPALTYLLLAAADVFFNIKGPQKEKLVQKKKPSPAESTKQKCKHGFLVGTYCTKCVEKEKKPGAM